MVTRDAQGRYESSGTPDYDLARFTSLMLMSPHERGELAHTLVQIERECENRKVFDADVEYFGWEHAALVYACWIGPVSNSEYLRSLAIDGVRFGRLTSRQAAGALNWAKRDSVLEAALLPDRDEQTPPAPARALVSSSPAQAPLSGPFTPATASADAESFELPTQAEVKPAVPNGWYTVVCPDKHRTFRLQDCRFADVAPGTQVIGVLTGSDNASDSSYLNIGFVRGKNFEPFKRYATNDKWSSAVRTLLTASETDWRQAGKQFAMQSGNCFVCNRLLTDPTSIELGIGPVCRERLGL